MDDRRQQVAHDQDRQVGRAVIRAMMRQIFLADGAGVAHFQVALQHRSAAAIRTFAAKSLADRRPKLTFFAYQRLFHRTIQ